MPFRDSGGAQISLQSSASEKLSASKSESTPRQTDPLPVGRELLAKRHEDERDNRAKQQRKKKPIQSGPILRLRKARVDQGQCSPANSVFRVWFTRVSSVWIGDPRCSRPTRRERSHPSRLPATRSETTENLAEILPRVDCPPGVATSFHHSVCASFPASCFSATLAQASTTQRHWPDRLKSQQNVTFLQTVHARY